MGCYNQGVQKSVSIHQALKQIGYKQQMTTPDTTPMSQEQEIEATINTGSPKIEQEKTGNAPPRLITTLLL